MGEAVAVAVNDHVNVNVNDHDAPSVAAVADPPGNVIEGDGGQGDDEICIVHILPAFPHTRSIR